MFNLAELQKRFSAAMQDKNALQSLPIVQPKYISIYRNSILFNHTRALKETYPVTVRLVGEDFFDTVAYFYLRTFPARDSNLNDYGKHLAEFLKNYTPTKTLIYLSEVAELEWGLHSAYYAADSLIFDPATLKPIPEQDHEKLIFHLQPSCQLLQFKYQTLDLWQACQNLEQDTKLHLQPERQFLLLVKQDYTVRTERLTPSEFIVLTELSKGISILEASHSVLLADTTVDLTACLQNFIMKGYIHSFTLCR